MLTEREILAELVKRGAPGDECLTDTRVLVLDQDDAAELHHVFVILHALAERGLVRAQVQPGRGILDDSVGWEITPEGRRAQLR